MDMLLIFAAGLILGWLLCFAARLRPRRRYKPIQPQPQVKPKEGKISLIPLDREKPVERTVTMQDILLYERGNVTDER